MANRAGTAMPQTSHRRTNKVDVALRATNRARSARSTGGFSLVEIVVALAIIAILVAAVSRGLMTSMQSDDVSAQVFAGNLVMNRIEAAVVRNESPEAMKKLCGTDWTISETLTKPSETNTIPWRIISLQSETRSSLSMKLALRMDPPPLPLSNISVPATIAPPDAPAKP